MNKPAIAPLGEAKPNTRGLPRARRAHGLRRAVLRRQRRGLAARRPSTAGDARVRSRLELLEAQRLAAARPAAPYAPFADGGFPTPSGKCEFYSATARGRGLDPLPDSSHRANRRRAPGARGAYPLAMISPPARNFLNSSFVNLPGSWNRGPALARDPSRRRGRRGHRRRAAGARLQRPRQLTLRTGERRTRPGVVVALVDLVAQALPDGSNANELTRQASPTSAGRDLLRLPGRSGAGRGVAHQGLAAGCAAAVCSLPISQRRSEPPPGKCGSGWARAARRTCAPVRPSRRRFRALPSGRMTG